MELNCDEDEVVLVRSRRLQRGDADAELELKLRVIP